MFLLQLSQDNVVSLLGWLPAKLNPEVLCVMTMTQDCAAHKSLLRRAGSCIETRLPLLEPATIKVGVMV